MILGGITSLTVGIKLGALWSTQTVRKKARRNNWKKNELQAENNEENEGGSCIRYNSGIL